MNIKILDILQLLQNVSNSSQKILTLIEVNKIDDAMIELNNRERLINIIQKQYANLKLEKVNQYNIDETNKLLNLISKEDDLIVKKLEEIKMSTNHEIAKLFKTKENFKGYNLKNLR
jgi:hypothetical protein